MTVDRGGGDEVVTFEKRDSYSSDDLVAIYEKHGMGAAIPAAKGMKGPKRDSQVSFILSYLTRIAPEFIAGELKGAGLYPAQQNSIVSTVMRHWKDGEKVLAWGDSYKGQFRKDAVSQALSILVKSDPAAALAHLNAVGGGITSTGCELEAKEAFRDGV